MHFGMNGIVRQTSSMISTRYFGEVTSFGYSFHHLFRDKNVTSNLGNQKVTSQKLVISSRN